MRVRPETALVEYLPGALLGWALALLVKIRPGSKGLPETNPPGYLPRATVREKVLVESSPGRLDRRSKCRRRDGRDLQTDGGTGFDVRTVFFSFVDDGGAK